MTDRRWDAIVIGGGHNGLVTAAYLARGGMNVLVLEANATVGGAASTREFAPGFRVDAGPHSLGWFHPGVIADLDLPRHGLEWSTAPDPPLAALAADGELVPIWRDPRKAGDALGRFGRGDVQQWPAFVQWVRKTAAVVGRLRDMVMPELPDPAVADLPSLIGLGLGWRRLGKRDMGELLRVLPLPVADLADDWLESDLVKGLVAAGALVGIDQGPMAQGTALPLFAHHGGDGIRPVAFPRGGVGRLVEALQAAAIAAGVTVRTAARVARVRVAGGRVMGVTLWDGEEVPAARVVSNVDPQSTMLRLVDPAVLDPDFVRSVRHIRCRGVTAKVHLALEQLPLRVPAHRELLAGLVIHAPSLRFLERAHDDAKHGAAAADPMIEWTVPTIRDPSCAPEGRHVVSAMVQWAPYALRDASWTAEAKGRLLEAVVRVLERVAPGVAEAVIASEVLVPPDLEQAFGLPRGDLYHGQPALDQLFFMRPVGGWARHRTPVEGLYLCGAGTHPAGGVTGAPGRLAARAVLADARRRR